MSKREYNRCRQLEEQVSAYMEQHQMLQAADTVYIGLSGGADSVCLFYVLLSLRERMGFSMEAVHVNHMLRSTAARDEAYVKDLCSREGIRLHVEHIDVAAMAREQGLTLEEAGREARYNIFRKLAGEGIKGKVAVAHHAHDQAETILFRLCRGSGLEGLMGMRPVRGRIIRPLLCMRRDEIEEYLELRGIAYMTDETNADNAYSRNRLRNRILPELTQNICRRTVEHMAHTGEVVSEAFDYLQTRIEEAYRGCVRQSSSCLSELVIADFLGLHPYLQKEVIRLAVSRICGSKKDISEVHIKAVMKLLTAETGSSCNLPYRLIVKRSYASLLFEMEEEACEREDFCCEISSEQLEKTGNSIPCILEDGRTLFFRVFPYDKDGDIPRNPYTKWLDYDKIEKPLLIRTPAEGDFFFFNDKNRKYVKDYMVNEKIPLRERKHTILVMSGKHMLYFPGKRISNYYKIDAYTRRVLEIKLQEDKRHG